MMTALTERQLAEVRRKVAAELSPVLSGCAGGVGLFTERALDVAARRQMLTKECASLFLAAVRLSAMEFLRWPVRQPQLPRTLEEIDAFARTLGAVLNTALPCEESRRFREAANELQRGGEGD